MRCRITNDHERTPRNLPHDTRVVCDMEIGTKETCIYPKPSGVVSSTGIQDTLYVLQSNIPPIHFAGFHDLIYPQTLRHDA